MSLSVNFTHTSLRNRTRCCAAAQARFRRPQVMPLRASFTRLVHRSRDGGVSTRASAPEAPDAEALVKPPPVEGSAAVYKAVLVACCGAFLFGYHLGVLNGPLQQIAQELSFSTNVALQGLVVSICLAGAAVGSLSGTVLADKLGRCKAFVVDCIPLIAGAALCAGATSSNALLAGRFLIGVGIGLASALVPLFVSEVAPAKIRGALGSWNQLMICMGILAALVVNVVMPATSWRMMFWLSVIPALILGAGMLIENESPTYLLSKGDKAGAEASAKALWGDGYESELYASTSKDSGDGKSTAVTWGETFKGINGKLVAVATSLFFIQQFSGINAIVYFSSSVFRDAGIPSEALASASVGLINVLGTIVAASLMDKQGRKQLLIVSLLGQGLSMLVMAAAFGIPALSGFVGPVALIFTLLYVMSFALGTGPVPGLLAAELLPVSIRGRGVSLAMVCHWVFNFALGQLFLSTVQQFGISPVYCFFATICMLGAFYVSSVLVETKGKTPEEIAELMR